MKKNKTNFQKIIKAIQKLDLSDDNKQRLEQILNNYYPRMCSISLLDFADRIFSDFIKIKKSDKNWICTCITCSAKGFWGDKDMQNGHFKSRSFRKYRFNIDNCRPQCKVCNVLKSGNYGEYMLAMQRILCTREGGGNLERQQNREALWLWFGSIDTHTGCRDRYGTGEKRAKEIIGSDLFLLDIPWKNEYWISSKSE